MTHSQILINSANWRAFYKAINNPDANKDSGSYPLIVEMPDRLSIVAITSKRKIRLALMFPEVGGQDGCRIVMLGRGYFKTRAWATCAIQTAVNEALAIWSREFPNSAPA